MRKCELRRLHLVTYENGLGIQETLVALRQRDEIPDQLLLLEHPPVITLGRGGDASNLLASRELMKSWRIRFYETTRGGDITYHGPGQLVGYPIIHLGEGRRDVRRYVTMLEEVLIRTVAEYGITAARRDGQRGVWAGNEKIAAVGVRVARWVTSHGFALNVAPNLAHFGLITPCGIRGAGVTSIEKLAGRAPSRTEVSAVIARHFAEVFDREIVESEAAYPVVKVIAHDGDRVLLLHRTKAAGDFWQPITGTIEPHEPEADAARRELREETGHDRDVAPMDLRQSFVIDAAFVNRENGHPVFADEVVYTAELDRNVPIALDTEEHDRFGWFSFEEAYPLLKWSDDREALERLEEVVRCPLPVVRETAETGIEQRTTDNES